MKNKAKHDTEVELLLFLLSLIHCILHWHVIMCLQPKGCSLTPRIAAIFHSASQMSTV